MRCVEVQKQIDLMIDNELNLLQKQEVERHFEACQSCRKSYQILQKTKATVKHQPQILPTAFLDRRILQAFENHHQPQEKVGFRQKFFISIPALAAISALFVFGLSGAFWLGKTTASPKIVTEIVTVERNVPTVETKIIESPKPETLTVTKYVKVPVIREKEVVKVVQIEKPMRKIQVVKAKESLPDYSDKTNALVTKINLEKFQPISELNVRVVKNGGINE